MDLSRRGTNESFGKLGSISYNVPCNWVISSGFIVQEINERGVPRNWYSLVTATEKIHDRLIKAADHASFNLMLKEDGGLKIVSHEHLRANARRAFDLRDRAICTNLGARAAVAVNLPGDFSTDQAVESRMTEAARAGLIIQGFIHAAQMITCADTLRRFDPIDARNCSNTATYSFDNARWLLRRHYEKTRQTTMPSPNATMAIVTAEVPRLAKEHQKDMTASLLALT